ncbi:MAG: multiheme c-type cytochrome [Acidobacteriota bacterium]
MCESFPPFARRRQPSFRISSCVAIGVLLSFALTPAAIGPSGVESGSAQEDASTYAGKKICLSCHEKRVRQHAGSNFDRSWRPASELSTFDLPKTVTEGAVRTTVLEEKGHWFYQIQLKGHPAQSFPVHSLMGGERFGLSLILGVDQLEARPLPRYTLVEARYMIEAGTHRLKLSPGFPAQAPGSYETALGRVLSPQFAEKCLECHGGIADPQLAQAGARHPKYLDTGVGCERCHGPGEPHLEAVVFGEKDLRIVNPAKLSHPRVIQLCGECHSGFFPVSSPRPKDVLISNQATAISNTACYIQSGGAFSCVSCHDPHSNAVHDDPAYVSTCLGCHSPREKTAAVCSVNPTEKCISCHMPVVEKPNNFQLTDHWIRVVLK